MIKINTDHHTIDLDKDGLAEVKIVGDGDTEVAQKFVADAERMFEENPDLIINAIVDMTEAGFSNLGGIDVYNEFMKSPKLGKIAFVVTNVGVRAMIDMATFGRKQPTEFFKTKEEAEVWIKTNS